jgi:tetratricopeptide (TPR) repeat protein
MQSSLLLCLSLFLFSSNASSSFPDRLHLLGLLENKKYDELGDVFLSFQSRYEEEKADEKLVFFVLETLANSNPEYEELINEWVETQAESYVPYLVRAYYYYGIAWSWRGHQIKSKTSAERLKKMQEFLQLASADIIQASKITPRLSVSDAHAIRVLMMLEDDEYKKPTLEEALRIDPGSYLVRSSYFWSLKPEWGGAPEELERFTKETILMAEKYPELNQLLGYSDYIFAEFLAERGKADTAAIHFDFAIDKGADHIIYRERGINYYHLQEYDKALQDLNQSLQMWPQDAKTLRWRSHTLQKMGKYEDALSDLDMAARISPMDRSILMARALLSRKMKRFEQVLSDYEQALFFNQNDADIWFERGMHYSHEFINFEEAVYNFNRATELNANNPQYWYEYAASLHFSLDCQIVTPLENYISLCNADSDCRAGELKWALHARNWLKENDRCPLKSSANDKSTG